MAEYLENKGPHRWKFLLWLVRHNRLPTASILHSRRIITDDLCNICGTAPETPMHALRDCSWAKEFWRCLIHLSHHSTFFNCDGADWVDWNLLNPANMYIWCDNWSMCFFDIVNFLRHVRNEVMHDARDEVPPVDLDMLHKRIDGLCQAVHYDPTSIFETIHTGWSRPEAGYLKLNIDAAVKTTTNDPHHHVGVGGVLRDDQEHWVKGFRGTLTPCSTLEAEMQAILFELEMAWKMKVLKLRVESDCKEAVQSIVEASTSHHHFEVIAQIRALLHKDWDVSLIHIWREVNVVADTLAKLGLQVPLHYMHTPDPLLLTALNDDRDDRSRPRHVTIRPGLSD